MSLLNLACHHTFRELGLLPDPESSERPSLPPDADATSLDAREQPSANDREAGESG